MPLPSNATKPLVLVFPCAHTTNYQRCLVIAQHLRPFFEMRFIHTDQQAHLVYQQGFETFNGNFFPLLHYLIEEKLPGVHETNPELMFLEQVEILETLQPALIIGDNDYTLSMAAEFTGIPIISVMNGYQSPYFANRSIFHSQFRNYEPFCRIREKYGLREKNAIQEELEGDLNWICDLPELFPQKELPYHYELIGPLIEVPRPTKATGIEKLSSFKKNILIDLDDTKPVNWLEVLDTITCQGYNLTVRATNQNPKLLHLRRTSSCINSAHLFPKADLLVCNTEGLLYEALFYGLPVIFKCQFAYQERIIEALEYWQIGTSWSHTTSTVKKTFDYWISNKCSDMHRTLQYKLKASLNSLGSKLLQSITLHFPYLERLSVPVSK